MEKFNKEMLKKLANQVMLDLSDQEYEELALEFETYLKQLDLLEKVNTDDVEEMVYPFEAPTQFIRNDEDVHVIDQKDALRNVPKVHGSYVAVPKVVK